MLPFIVRNFAVHVDGQPKRGTGDQLSIPALRLKTEEFRGGGMDIPVDLDLGMEKLEASWRQNNFDNQPYMLFGLAPGNLIPLTFRGHLHGENGTQRPVIINMRSLITEVDPGSWEPGSKTEQNVTVNPHYLKITHGEYVIVEIDPYNSRRIINGVDQLANMRVNLGL